MCCRTESAFKFSWFFLFYLVSFILILVGVFGFSIYFVTEKGLFSSLLLHSFTLASASLLRLLLLLFSEENLSRESFYHFLLCLFFTIYTSILKCSCWVKMVGRLVVPKYTIVQISHFSLRILCISHLELFWNNWLKRPIKFMRK